MFLRERGGLEAFTHEAFALYWEEGGAPDGIEADEDAPVSAVARLIGVDPEEVLSGAASPESKQALKAATSEVVERGASSEPRPSSSATRCSGATTGSTSSKRPCSRNKVRPSRPRLPGPTLEARTPALG
jgi:hypothetical protein